MSDTPTQFHAQGFDERIKRMGDLAEGKCAEWLESIPRGYVRYGLDRPPLRMDMLPARIRHTPDFLTSASFIECKGFGRDQIAKLKLEDMNCLSWWNDCHPVEFFFYDSSRERSCTHPLAFVRDTLLGDARVQLGVFNDSVPKPYFAVPAAVVFGE